MPPWKYDSRPGPRIPLLGLDPRIVMQVGINASARALLGRGESQRLGHDSCSQLRILHLFSISYIL